MTKKRDQAVATIDSEYPGMRERLGKETDAEVANAFGVSNSTVQLLRSNLGIEPYGRRGRQSGDIEEKYPGMLARLGKEPDSQIAKDYGCNRTNVAYYRKKLGIESVHGPRPKPRKPSKRTPSQRLWVHLYELWIDGGRKRDPEQLADLLGLAVGTLQSYRRSTEAPMTTLIAMAGHCDAQLIFDGETVIVRSKGPKIKARGSDWSLTL